MPERLSEVTHFIQIASLCRAAAWPSEASSLRSEYAFQLGGLAACVRTEGARVAVARYFRNPFQAPWPEWAALLPRPTEAEVTCPGAQLV